jgi:hypothetical protein
MRAIVFVAALLCATIPSVSAQLHPSRCQVAQEYCPSLQRCLPQWAYCPYPPSAAPLESEVTCPQHTYLCNKTNECLPEWSTTCVTPTAVAASSIVREPPTPVCPHLRFWCPQTGSCLPPWACCTCSEEEASHACRYGTYWCPASRVCVGYWSACPTIAEQPKSEAEAIQGACSSGKRFCAKGNRCLPEHADCAAPASETACRAGFFCFGRCYPPWACCNCRESETAQCASGTFFCKAKNQCLGFAEECK